MKRSLKLLISLLLYYIIFFIVLFNNPCFAVQKFKEVHIIGLKINSEQSLITFLELDKLSKQKKHFKSAAIKINRFYHKGGFILAKTYLIEETPEKLTVLVDEGRLQRILFLGLDSIDTLRMKYYFNLDKRIYNIYAVQDETQQLKEKYKFKAIYFSLKPAEKGDMAFFQLDKEFDFPLLGKTRLPFFEEISSRYNLEIRFVKKPASKSKDLSYGLRTSYKKGLMPEVEYYYPFFIRRNDSLIIGSSMGILYGFDLKFNELPKWTFFEVHSNYNFPPTMEDYFTPMATVSAHYSRASRADIGLASYNFLIVKGILAPGITLLRKFRIYAGAGAERAFILEPDIDKNAEYQVDIQKHTETWELVEARTLLDLRIWKLKRTRKLELEATNDYYFKGDKTFNKANIKLDGIIDFKNLDSYCNTIEYGRIWDKPPFYQEISVADSNFKGFMGKSYYSRNMIRTANEYMASVYKDSYYLGFFTDLIYFEGSGYDLTGYQKGIVAGIAGHIIFLDQFEFNLFYGKDYLFSKEESQYNIYFQMHKKW